ncbi:hypothetical protein BDA96_06G299000 [Sorghum bicolor]|nr:hypothetical protein BDA96_06G299000 [Sorghum bicolor]
MTHHSPWPVSLCALPIGDQLGTWEQSCVLMISSRLLTWHGTVPNGMAWARSRVVHVSSPLHCIIYSACLSPLTKSTPLLHLYMI